MNLPRVRAPSQATVDTNLRAGRQQATTQQPKDEELKLKEREVAFKLSAP
jgi:hypothetical protein